MKLSSYLVILEANCFYSGFLPRRTPTLSVAWQMVVDRCFAGQNNRILL